MEHIHNNLKKIYIQKNLKKLGELLGNVSQNFLSS
jgi:hypothetical protein